MLVAMNNTVSGDDKEAAAPVNAVTPPESTRGFPSDAESASPTASGYSELNERQSSADTTPPPHQEAFGHHIPEYISKKYNGGGLSRSYQPTPVSGFAGSAPNPAFTGLGHSRQLSQECRPPSSGKNATGQDDRELAAAVELLSCSFGSNNGSHSVGVPLDAPPVKPATLGHAGGRAPLASRRCVAVASRGTMKPASRGT